MSELMRLNLASSENAGLTRHRNSSTDNMMLTTLEIDIVPLHSSAGKIMNHVPLKVSVQPTYKMLLLTNESIAEQFSQVKRYLQIVSAIAGRAQGGIVIFEDSQRLVNDSAGEIGAVAADDNRGAEALD
jgi:hypothetical protein